jgi:hypothetical protein
MREFGPPLLKDIPLIPLKKRICYLHQEGSQQPGPISTYYYGKEHPMKPSRLALTHNLIVYTKYIILGCVWS